jgi:hypothetical protein
MIKYKHSPIQKNIVLENIRTFLQENNSVFILWKILALVFVDLPSNEDITALDTHYTTITRVRGRQLNLQVRSF